MSTDRVEKDVELAGIGKPQAAGPATWQRRDPVDPIQYQSWCDNQRASMGLAEPDVQQTATRGVDGPATELPHAGAIQASFGHHDVSGVQAHVGGPAADAAQQMGAQAYATGNCVAFASQPDLHLAAHEAAHVVQQRGGVQLQGGVGQAGDAYEQHADQVADAVVRGDSAAQLLDASPEARSSTASAVQRHTESEHAAMGNAASGDRRIEFPNGVSLKFGAIVAIAGDYYGGPQELWDMVMKPGPGPGTISEVQYLMIQIERDRHAQRVRAAKRQQARSEAKNDWKSTAESQVEKDDAQGDWQSTVDREDAFSPETKQAVNIRYLALARSNAPHFLDPDGTGSPSSKVSNEEWKAYQQGALPGSGPKGYRLNHLQALSKAQEAGTAGKPIDEAMFFEAFGAHYLTDVFSSGHARTPRRAMRAHYNDLCPMFYENVVGFMAEQISEVLEKNTYGGILSEEVVYHGAFGQKGAYQTLRETFDATGGMTFGDVMSGVSHDYDNEHGVRANVDGRIVTLKGDGFLDEGDQFEVATHACAMGILEVESAYAMGQNGKSLTEIYETFTAENHGLFAAETMLPKVLPDAQQGADQQQVPSQAKTVDELLSHDNVRVGLAILFREKAATIEGALKSFDAKKQEAVKKRITSRMRGGPDSATAFLRDIIDWVPDTGGGIDSPGADVQSNANEYVAKVRQTPGGMASLSLTQRTKLVRMLAMPSLVSDNEAALDEIIAAAPPKDRDALVQVYLDALP